MKLHPSETALLEAFASARNSWLQAAQNALEDPANAIWSEKIEAWTRLGQRLSSEDGRTAFSQVVRELLSGLVHSSLVILDGGSSLAETTSLKIEDEERHVFKPFLHEFWPEFGRDHEV